jgi:YfiH family protein
MQSHPFTLLKSYNASIDVMFCTKEDNVHSDEDIKKLTGASQVASLHQVHGGEAVIVRQPTSRTIKADALFTDQKDLTLTIRFADCQNFILFVPSKNILGLVHAGWRGMRQKILTASFNLLKKEWGIPPAEVLVCAGPSLCTTCADFTDPETEAPELSAFINNNCIDLRAAADAELATIGVLASHMVRLPDCTRCNPKKYWTYRGGDKQKVTDGHINCLAVTLKRG